MQALTGGPRADFTEDAIRKMLRHTHGADIRWGVDVVLNGTTHSSDGTAVDTYRILLQSGDSLLQEAGHVFLLEDAP